MPFKSSFRIDLKNVEGEAIQDRANVTFTRMQGSQMLKNVSVDLPRTNRFNLMTERGALSCAIWCDHYRLVSVIFLPREDEEQAPPLKAFRDSAHWKPEFTAWAALGERFGRLGELLDKSSRLALLDGTPLGRFTDATYDQAPLNVQLAKMCLLNLYCVLTDTVEPTGLAQEQPWMALVNEILFLDRERLVAEVDPVVKDVIGAIQRNPRRYNSFPGDTSLHGKNVPAGYSVQKAYSVKTNYQSGNIQFTIAEATHNGNSVVLLDCDMDEHSNVVLHLGDVVAHLVTGGTHPVDIHEYIVMQSVAFGAVPDFGYRLIPVGHHATRDGSTAVAVAAGN